MEPSIYSFSLCIALPLMLFFGFYFLFAKIPEKKIFENYLRSRRMMGVALLLFAANYSVHFFLGIRFENVNSAILMNLSTYFLCYYLFSSAMMTLLDRFYITRKRSWTHIILWVIFSILSGVVLLLLPGGTMQKIGLLVLAAWLVIYGLVLARRVIVAYRRAVRIFDDTHAFHSYQNYLLFYEQVENAFEQDIQSEEKLLTDTETEPEIVSGEEVPVSYTEIIEKVDNWIKADGYVQQGLTIKELSKILYTNRTYLSAYIKTTYKMTFREWITGLRLEYAKNILKEHPKINIQKLAESSGFLSRSNFIKSFTEKEGCTPAKWKKANLE